MELIDSKTENFSISLSKDAFKSKFQLYFIQQLKNLSQSSKNIYDFIKLIDFIIFNNEQTDPTELNQFILEFKNEFKEFLSLNSIKDEFKKSYYSISLREILNQITTNKSDQINSSIKKNLLKIINSTNFSDTFNVIYEFIQQDNRQNIDFCLFLMRNFIRNHLIKNILIEKFGSESDNFVLNSNLIEDKLIQKICNLPDKMSRIINYNKTATNKHNMDTFLPKNYFNILSIDLWLCLKSIRTNLTSESTSLSAIKNLSFLFGKISFLSYSETLFDCFVKNLISVCYSDKIYQLIANKLYDLIPYKYLESCLLSLVKNASSHEDISVLLNDLVLKNSNIKYFLCDKFFFLKVINQEKFIQNVIGYLHETDQRRIIYYEIFRKLLNIWSNQASITQTSYDQHLFLTKCILVCYSFLYTDDKKILIEDMTKSILNGVEKHLYSPFENIRCLGMVVGEILMNEINFTGQDELKKLKFDYEKTKEIEQLISLSKKPKFDSIYKKIEIKDDSELCLELNKIEDSDSNGSVIFENKKLNINIIQNKSTIDSDDDDDDLKPYDTSNDIPISKTKKPIRLRDCLDALIYSEDPEKIEISLKSVETLCNLYHFELEEICVELLKIILHKTNSFSIPDFEIHRMNALICITKHYPKECAIFLTSQFYEPGFSITQRIDILQVLSTTIQKLSDPKEDEIKEKRLETNKQENYKLKTFDDFEKNIRLKVNEKTRIFSIKKVRSVKTKENRFSDTFGYFFFPILNPYDKTRSHFSLIDQDFMVLGKMIFSLAVIMYYSENTKVHENMIKALTDFLWSMKHHSQPFVRKSILFAYVLIILVISDDLLFSVLNNYFIELKYWLEDVILNEPNIECKKEAIDCLNLLAERVKSKLKIMSDQI